MHLFRNADPVDILRIIPEKEIPEFGKCTQVVAEDFAVHRGRQTRMIEHHPLVYAHRAFFRIAVDPKDIRVEIVDRHDTSSFPEILRKIGSFLFIHDGIIGLPKCFSKESHIFIRKP